MSNERNEQARSKQEAKILSKLREMAQRKLSSLQTQATAGNLGLEQPEKDMLFKVNSSGLREGVVAGCLCLFGLRRFRGALLRRLHQQGTAQPNSHAHSSLFQTLPPSSQKTPKRGMLVGGISWMVDMGVSFYFATFVSLQFTDFSVLGDLPLVQGRSRVAAEFCPDLITEIASIRKESSSDRALLNNPRSDNLRNLMRFHNNCLRRKTYENQLRRETGSLDSDGPIAIPPPGVPSDGPMGYEDFSESDDRGSTLWAEDEEFGTQWNDSPFHDQDNDA